MKTKFLAIALAAATLIGTVPANAGDSVVRRVEPRTSFMFGLDNTGRWAVGVRIDSGHHGRRYRGKVRFEVPNRFTYDTSYANRHRNGNCWTESRYDPATGGGASEVFVCE